MPYTDTQQHSRLRSATGCAGRSSCSSSGSSSFFVSRRALAPKRTPHNTNLDRDVHLRAGGASSRSAWHPLRQPGQNPEESLTIFERILLGKV